MNPVSQILFWVCLFESPDHRRTVSITARLRDTLRQTPAAYRLLYVRMFSDMQEAIGHRLFIESLPPMSLDSCIQTINPRRIDMRPCMTELYAAEDDLKSHT